MKRPASQIRPRSCRKPKPSEPAKPNWCGISFRRDLYEKMKVLAAENGRTFDEEMDICVREGLDNLRVRDDADDGGWGYAR